jgi:hypothetical protein
MQTAELQVLHVVAADIYQHTVTFSNMGQIQPKEFLVQHHRRPDAHA